MVDGIIIRDLSVYYETLEALSMVNLDIRPGRLTILLGPNGAGKTTLINAVSGLLHDRMQRAFLNDDRLGLTGRIICDGEDITNSPPHERIRRGVIHCPEKRRPFPEMNVLDNLLIGAYLRKDRQAVK
ncbi:MAG: ATP-binding cassette domain-containing protein, partial [Thermodesulfobacteriota bacterium]|nr:ATP-binding cassette domain-containing protein [Thermodesulfobacteriota bacterium]